MKRWIKFSFVCLVIVMAAVNALSAREKEIPLSKVPQNVLETAKNEVPGIKLIEAEIITRGEKVFYEVEGRHKGKKYEMHITSEGKVIKAGREKWISVSSLPEVVVDAISKKMEGIRLIEAAKITKLNGDVFYSAEGRKGNTKYEFEVSADGKIIDLSIEN